MPNDERSTGGKEPAAGLAHGGGAFHKQPGVLAGASALLGLGMGVLLGRSTVVVPEGASRVERPLVAAPQVPETKVQAPEPVSPNSYRQRFTRLPKGGTGFAQDDTAGRYAARVAASEARLKFQIVPDASDYALTAILRVKDGSAGNLKPSIDGKALGSWALRGEWASYIAPVARDLLSEGPHDLSLAVSGLSGSAAVNVDSVSVAPIKDGVTINIGPDAAGHLVDGFAKLEGKTVWSLGGRSWIAAVLAPREGTYRLRVRGYALPTLAPLSVKAKVNGTDVGEATVESKTSEVTWLVPAKLPRAGLNEIEFTYPKTARPADYNPKSKDRRVLAVRYTRISLTPEP